VVGRGDIESPRRPNALITSLNSMRRITWAHKIAFCREQSVKVGLAIPSLLLCANCPGAVVVPIQIERGNPVASARINGVEGRLVMDSAGGSVTLKSETIRKVGGKRMDETRATTDAMGTNSARAIVRLDSFDFGPVKLGGIDADEASAYVAQSPADGIVGRSILNKFAVVYDYSGGKITLISPEANAELDAECTGNRIDLVAASEETAVSVARIDQREIRVLWDTGATYSFIKKSVADTEKLPVVAPFYKSQRFALGEHEFGPMQFVVIDAQAPLDVDGFVGSNFFMGHIVCIDPSHRTVRVRDRPR
jgi:predicted aspartyl protease